MLILTVLFSCGSPKSLQEGEKWYDGTQIRFVDKKNIFDQNVLMRDIRLTVVDKDMEPIFQPTMIRKSEARLENLLRGSGYLKASVQCRTDTSKQKIKIKCDLTLNQRYRIDSVFYPVDTLPMVETLKPMYRIEFLKSGDFVQRNNIIGDLEGFVETANNHGFPFVNEDDVLFIVDTTAGEHLVDIHMQIKPTSDSTRYKRHKYGNFYINPNYSLDKNTPFDTTEMDHKSRFKLKEGYDFLSEKAWNKVMYIREFTIYNKSTSTITSNRMLNLGLFKFVNVKTKVNPDRTIDHFFNLTPYKMESISAEFDINNRSGNFWGSSVKTSYVNKNLFKGAERFELSLTGGLETQFSSPFINTSDLAVEASLTIPSIVLPFPAFRTFKTSLPKTFMSLGYNHQSRLDFYSYSALQAKYGFRWNETQYKSSFLVPLNLQRFDLLSTTAAFDDLLENDPRLAVSFQTTFVLGWLYEYEYNRKEKHNPINQFYFKGSFESAGNILSGVQRLFSSNPSGTILGTPYAQYLRMTLDFRKYWGLKVGSIATRFVAGAAYAYGNSTEVPYAKQYSVGGANDLRAFELRAIGPGTFVSQDSTSNNNQFFDQTGDIKLEFNIEYRFPIYRFFKGAFFLDAGNVWLFDETSKPGGAFRFNDFYRDIAVGTGFSLRIDIEYLIFRTYLAFPLRNIDDSGNFAWVTDEIDFFDSSWRSNNLEFNVGIGYPF